jgi:thioredoxin reductase
MTSTGFDRYSIAGKFRPPEKTVPIAVVGGGEAGAAAAIAAAQAGAEVMLIDENPISADLMGSDIPQWWGGRMTGAVRNKERMLEQVFAASPVLETAFEAGVDLALGVYAWGAWVPREGLRALPSPTLALADEERSWVVGFERLIVAAGARDFALSFAGWERPGVMGAGALHSLLTRYNAFAGRRIVILGSGDLGLGTALLALDAGLEVVAIVEARETPQGAPDLLRKVQAAGVAILTGRIIIEATGGVDGVDGVTLAPSQGAAEQPISLACDTVCVALGRVPAIELLNAAGVPLEMKPDSGGHVPWTPDGSGSALPEIFVAGDCAGLGDDAAASGRRAGLAAAASLGLCAAPPARARASVGDALAYQGDWVRAALATGGLEVNVCQCEEVSRASLLDIQAPAYLGPATPKLAERSLVTLLDDGPINTDQIKRLTRVCMGLCQGRRCREQSALMLAQASNLPPSAIPLTGYRAPVRPLPLKVIAAWDEAADMAAGWDVWFGITGQWIPYRDIGTEREAAHMRIISGNMHL